MWPKVAELGLLAGLGAGKLLVRLALEELRVSGVFDFVVLQATMASVSFYEELGFVRVGAVAKYHPEGTSLESNPVQGYRHWACADESQPEQFGDTSYMMALKLSSLSADTAITKMLNKRLVGNWPAVQSGQPWSAGKRKGKAHHGGSSHSNVTGILKPVGSSLQVGDMSLNVDEGDEARLQLRYEVERILDSKNGQYLVKWKHLPVDDATWEKATSELLQSPAAKAALGRFKKHPPSQKSEGKRSHHGPLEQSHKKKSHHADAGSSTAAAAMSTPRWSHKVVRSLLHDQQAGLGTGSVGVSPRIFNGGLGEPPRQREIPVEAATPANGLEREHRYWLVVRYASISNKCTLVPLLASGRFGGCGRRAGRIRWRPAPLKQGYERDAQASSLELVASEPVTGARETEGEVWCIEDPDVEHAAREQAAAARNKRRQILDSLDPTFDDPAVSLALGLTRSGSIARSTAGMSFGSGPSPKKREGSHRPPRDPNAPPRKKKRLAPASNSCLACTKGKHCAHTCGVRGKAAEAAAAAAAAAAAEAAAAGSGEGSGSGSSS